MTVAYTPAMTADAPIGLALIGVGRMGSFHARALATTSAVSVVAIADAHRPSIDALRAVHPEATAYESPEHAFAHAGVEACLIATPTPTHPALVAAALDARLHVLCEKPLSLDPTESDRLGARAIAADRILQVGFWRRFSPPWARLREALVAGRVGSPLYLRLSQWDADPPPASFCDPAVSGGLAIDCGVHEFDLAEWLTGLRIERVRAWSPPPLDGGLAEVGDVDNVLAVLELTGGVVATVDLSRNARYGDDVRTEVLGSQGALFVDILPLGRTRIGTSTGVKVLAGSEVDDATVAGVVAQAEAFAAAIRGGQLERPGAEASARATRVGHAVARALQSGEAVEVAS